MISEREGFPVEEQIILYAGKPLQDEYELTKLNDLSTLDIEVRMLGGKFFFLLKSALYLIAIFEISGKTGNKIFVG